MIELDYETLRRRKEFLSDCVQSIIEHYHIYISMEATVREQLMSFTCGLDFGVITV
jgi:hypothetical protein